MMSRAVTDAVEGSVVAERHARALRGQGERLRALAAGLPDVVRRMTEGAQDARRWYDEVSDVMNIIGEGGAAIYLPPIKLIQRHEQADDAWYEARKQRRLAKQAVRIALALGRRLDVGEMAVCAEDGQESEEDMVSSAGQVGQRGAGSNRYANAAVGIGGADGAVRGGVGRDMDGDMDGGVGGCAHDSVDGDARGDGMGGACGRVGGGAQDGEDDGGNDSVDDSVEGGEHGGVRGSTGGDVDGGMNGGVNGGACGGEDEEAHGNVGEYIITS